jgi:hypothetical protein
MHLENVVRSSSCGNAPPLIRHLGPSGCDGDDGDDGDDGVASVTIIVGVVPVVRVAVAVAGLFPASVVFIQFLFKTIKLGQQHSTAGRS